MNFSLLGIGSINTNLNSDLITKLKSSETSSILEPLNLSISSNKFTEGKLSNISSMLGTFKTLIEDQVNNSIFTKNTYENVGTSVIFDIENEAKLIPENIFVDIISLASKDIVQSDEIADINSNINLGNLDISINNENLSFDTNGKTYDQLINEINNNELLNANLEEVSKDKYRLIIKSKESGIINKLNISGTMGSALGLDLSMNNVKLASNMEANVNGVKYSGNSNELKYSNVSITATSIGSSSLTITKDDSKIKEGINNILNSYNQVKSVINNSMNDDSIKDKGILRNLSNSLKDTLFNNVSGISIFNLGVNMDKEGMLNLSDEKFDKIPKQTVKNFIENGFLNNFANTLEKYIGTNGDFNKSLELLQKQNTNNLKEIEMQTKYIDTKYNTLASQFASYNSLINSFESSFSGLKSIIEYSMKTKN